MSHLPEKNQINVTYGGYMVAFAGRIYAARSIPITVSDTRTITKYTLTSPLNAGTVLSFFLKLCWNGIALPALCHVYSCTVLCRTCSERVLAAIRALEILLFA
ncbi:hypothetical protein Ddye_003050 [Dipteronia dyeriana]|uniref:Uncharacterized protein n=1 Tax=Dipteronia dyeriana TaxID=168575 RepID=A0AAD9XS65_9ROSI|nr:hypothetical protein Ddye_003050 [Dipteronia dyeriana]